MTAKTAHSTRSFCAVARSRSRRGTALRPWRPVHSLRSQVVATFAALFVLIGPLAQAGRAGVAEVVLPRPIEIRTKTYEGAQVRGMLEKWNDEAFTGTFGARRWTELPAPELNRVYRMVMDERSAEQWIALGELLMQVKGGDRMSETAFSRARRLDKESGPAIEAARVRGTEKKRIESERRLRDILPEGQDFDARPWPILSDTERSAATDEMKKDAERIMRDAGASMPLIETKYFLLYAELPPQEAARWASQLDGMYDMVMKLLHVEPEMNLFWGKAVVFIFPTRERFRVVEASAFSFMVPEGVLGLCHMKGPKVFINSYRDADEFMFTSVLLHETTHGIMHRYLTPKRLPTWANEGFADRIAHMAMTRVNLRNPMDRLRREQGVAYMRQSGDVARVMRMDYENGTWPGENSVGYAVGYMLCNFMLDVVPRLTPPKGKDRFKDWVVAVKGGKPWDKALADDYGFSAEVIAAEAVKWFRTND